MTSSSSSLCTPHGSTASQPDRLSSKDRLAEYAAHANGLTRTEREQLIPALASRCFHLPGYSWCGDLTQYIFNNHPLLGICCHHRLHPIRMGMRVVILVGSVMFGLAVTNILWLWFILNEIDEDREFIAITVRGDTTPAIPDGTPTAGDRDVFAITQGRLLLWTIGGGLHAIFDQTIWFFAACPCCLPGQSLECFNGCRKYFQYMVVTAVTCCTALATFALVLRTVAENDEEPILVSNSTSKPTISVSEWTLIYERQMQMSALDFLLSYGLELTFAFILYNPLIGFILFSGALGCCGRIPILGGRPYEVRQEKRKQQQSTRQLTP